LIFSKNVIIVALLEVKGTKVANMRLYLFLPFPPRIMTPGAEKLNRPEKWD